MCLNSCICIEYFSSDAFSCLWPRRAKYLVFTLLNLVASLQAYLCMQLLLRHRFGEAFLSELPDLVFRNEDSRQLQWSVDQKPHLVKLARNPPELDSDHLFYLLAISYSVPA